MTFVQLFPLATSLVCIFFSPNSICYSWK